MQEKNSEPQKKCRRKSEHRVFCATNSLDISWNKSILFFRDHIIGIWRNKIQSFPVFHNGRVFSVTVQCTRINCKHARKYDWSVTRCEAMKLNDSPSFKYVTSVHQCVKSQVATIIPQMLIAMTMCAFSNGVISNLRPFYLMFLNGTNHFVQFCIVSGSMQTTFLLNNWWCFWACMPSAHFDASQLKSTMC